MPRPAIDAHVSVMQCVSCGVCGLLCSYRRPPPCKHSMLHYPACLSYRSVVELRCFSFRKLRVNIYTFIWRLIKVFVITFTQNWTLQRTNAAVVKFGSRLQAQGMTILCHIYGQVTKTTANACKVPKNFPLPFFVSAQALDPMHFKCSRAVVQQRQLCPDRFPCKNIACEPGVPDFSHVHPLLLE